MNSESDDDINAADGKDSGPVEHFKLTLMRRVWLQIAELIEQDGKSPEKFKLKSEYVKLLQSELSAHENMKISLRDRKARIYDTKKKKTTNYLVAYSICTQCDKYGAKYNFIVKEKPLDSDLTVDVHVKKVGNHNHEDKIKNAKEAKLKPKSDKEKTITPLKLPIKQSDLSTVTASAVTQGSTSSYMIIDDHINHTNIQVVTENYESLEPYKKLLKSYENKDNSSQDLFNNIMYVANSQKTCIPADNVVGFVRDLKIFDEFSFHMHSEYQIKSILLVQPEYRILHLGLSGNLVKINGSAFKYHKILNHFVLLKDSRSMCVRNAKSLLVSEMINTKINAYNIADFYRSVQKNFNDLYPKLSLNVRYIVTDFVWENIHASLDVFANETVIQYANRVFHMTKEELNLTDQTINNKTCVITCASHTFFKFIRILKKQIKESKTRVLACFTFNSLLNSTDLDSMMVCFRHICHSFLNPARTELNFNSLRELQSLISRRTRDEMDILKCLNSLEIVEKSERKREVVYKQIDEYSIKINSPFTKLFEDIENQVRQEILVENSTVLSSNMYHCPDLIKILQEHFMPYVFIWTSLCLKGNEFQMSRLTNASLDQFITQRRTMIKLDVESLSPAQYAMLAYPLTRHKTDQFVRFQQEEIEKRLNEFKISENEPYYLSSVDDYLDNDKDDVNESININLNEIEFDFF